MRALAFEWRTTPPGLIDASVLRPDTLCALTDAELFSVRIACGSESVELGDLVRVRVLESAPPETLRIDGSPRFFRLATGMRSGQLEVNGHGGTLAAAGLLGGEVVIRGDVGHGAAQGMEGGSLRIEGDAGDGLGGPLPGARFGMAGGEIFVDGNAGASCGRRQRRGTIVIGGTAGPNPGLGLGAGTLIVCEGDLVEPGIGMNRGTILGLAAREDPPPGFALDGPTSPVFWRVLARRLATLGFPGAERFLDARFRSYSGDRTALGRGEILYHVPAR